MITKCCCENCSHYDDEMCTLETGKQIGTAPDDWCLGWRDKRLLHPEPIMEGEEDD